MVVEARVRLVAGLKRYFHAKRGEGLLSAEGMQLLDHACDLAMDRADHPLDIWSTVRRYAHPRVDSSQTVRACCGIWVVT